MKVKFKDVGVISDITDCSVLRTPAILPVIRNFMELCSTSCSCRGGSSSHCPTCKQAYRGTRLLTLISFKGSMIQMRIE